MKKLATLILILIGCSLLSGCAKYNDPICRLEVTNFGEKEKTIIADFYNKTSSLGDCDLVKSAWLKTHGSSVCICTEKLDVSWKN